MTESTLLSQIRQALNATGRVRIVRNNVGVDVTRGVRYGLGVGSPDLVGVLSNGRVFCIEVKTLKGRLSNDQKTWGKALRKWGGFATTARSVKEALDALDRAENGDSE